jgi:membrane protein
VQLKDALNAVGEVGDILGHGVWHFLRSYVVSLAALLARLSPPGVIDRNCRACDVDWYDVWLGAIVTAILFEIGKSAIGFYIGKQGLDSTYGAAASIIVVLIWLYYSSQIMLMGAEVTHAFAIHRGSIKKRGETPGRADPA